MNRILEILFPVTLPILTPEIEPTPVPRTLDPLAEPVTEDGVVRRMYDVRQDALERHFKEEKTA